MDYITFIPCLTDVREDYLRDVKDYATYICVSEEEASTAINLFGKDKTYIIMCFQEPDFDNIQNLDISNFIIQIYESYYSDKLAPFSFMFFEAANTWEQANHYAHLGAAAIRVEAPLTFQTDFIQKWKQKHNIKIFTTIDSNKVTDVRQWFLRPEDCSLYTEIFDGVCIKFSLIASYAHGLSPSKLSLIIPSLNPSQDVNALYISPSFQKKRMNCKQRCQEPTGVCAYCVRIMEVTKQIERITSNV